MRGRATPARRTFSPGTFSGDAGLQPERTALAWQRTVLGLLGNGALVVLRQSGGPVPQVPSLVLGAALVVLATAVGVIGHRREKALSRAADATQLRPGRELAVVGWGVVLVCAGAVVLLALPSGR